MNKAKTLITAMYSLFPAGAMLTNLFDKKDTKQGRIPGGKKMTRNIRGYWAELPKNNRRGFRPMLSRSIRRAWKGKNKRNLASTLERAVRRGVLKKIPGVDATRREAWAVV